MNLLKKGEGVPLLNFEGGPRISLLNFEGGPGVLLLNFRGVPGPTFKLWGGFRVPGPRVPRSWVSGSWSHFYTMPLEISSKKSVFVANLNLTYLKLTALGKICFLAKTVLTFFVRDIFKTQLTETFPDELLCLN